MTTPPPSVVAVQAESLPLLLENAVLHAVQMAQTDSRGQGDVAFWVALAEHLRVQWNCVMSASRSQAEAAREGWVLTAPDGRQWRATSALLCAAAEQCERIPAKVALDRIWADVDQFELEERAAIAKELEPHALAAVDCPPSSMVVPLYSIRRMLSAAAPLVSAGDEGQLP